VSASRAGSLQTESWSASRGYEAEAEHSSSTAALVGSCPAARAHQSGLGSGWRRLHLPNDRFLVRGALRRSRHPFACQKRHQQRGRSPPRRPGQQPQPLGGHLGPRLGIAAQPCLGHTPSFPSSPGLATHPRLPASKSGEPLVCGPTTIARRPDQAHWTTSLTSIAA
jgi:hypothetical protein